MDFGFNTQTLLAILVALMPLILLGAGWLGKKVRVLLRRPKREKDMYPLVQQRFRNSRKTMTQATQDTLKAC